MNRDVAVVAAAVAVHLALTLAHGWAHATIPVPYEDWQGVYAGVVLFLAPVAGVVALVVGRVRLACWFLVLAGVAGFAFEAAFHFLVAGPDHVGSVEHGTSLFASTAVLTTLGDAVLVAAGGWRFRRFASGRRTVTPA